MWNAHGVTESQEIMDARAGKRKGTPFATVVLRSWHEVKGFGKRKGCALIRKSWMHVLAKGKAVL